MTKADIFEVVKKNVLEIVPGLEPEAVSVNKSLSELGANSVDRMEVITMSMEDLDVSIPLLSFAKAVNIGGIVDIFFANLG